MSLPTDEDWIEGEDARARLILDLPPSFDLAALSCLKDRMVAGVITAIGHPDLMHVGVQCSTVSKALIVRLEPGSRLDIPSFVNGCELESASGVAKMRQAMGPNFIIGVVVGDEGHQAVVAGEAGADYVTFFSQDAEADEDAFETILGLCEWWGQTMVLPCAVSGNPTTDEARRLAEAGADFIIIGNSIWQGTASPDEVVKPYIQAISGVRREQWSK